MNNWLFGTTQKELDAATTKIEALQSDIGNLNQFVNTLIAERDKLKKDIADLEFTNSYLRSENDLLRLESEHELEEIAEIQPILFKTARMSKNSDCCVLF